ncbi:MAG: hypothetical protein LR017_00875 [Candidatus Pacebacteria bacterium]|nr:hypothetical protein [Candidatus Paceibacterota bacterium]
MPHPFTKLFDTALKKSTYEENFVLKEALKIKERGYNPAEIHRVLETLQQGLIDDADAEIVAEAVEEIERYLV